MSTVRPFTYRASEAELDDLRRRVLATRLPEKETTNDLSQGVPLATMQKVTCYWATEYDWRKVEAKLNSFPQFVTLDSGGSHSASASKFSEAWRQNGDKPISDCLTA